MNDTEHFHAFSRALAHDRKLVLKMQRILHRAQAVNIDFRGTARRRLLELTQLLTHNIDRERSFLDEVDLYKANDPEEARGPFGDVDQRLARVRASAVALERALTTSYTLDPQREPELDTLGDLVRRLAASRSAASTLVEAFTRSAGRATPPSVSRRIAMLCVRVLPWEARQRYLDEYLSEFEELAQAKHRYRRQVLFLYALRLLVRTPALRFALRVPAREESLPYASWESR